jgi:glycosyltransferase involved in cell wall biosynthesis
MRAGDLFLAVSDAVRGAALKAGYLAERAVTHYIGVDLQAFALSETHDETTILHVGRLVEKKGTALLLAAFARARAEHPRAELVIIGQGPLRPRLERMAGRLGIGESVRFLGARSPSEVAEWMGRAAMLVVPSVTARDGDAEGLPTVIPEAAATGLPVVGSDHSGIPEAIDDGRTGFVVPEGQVEALSARMAQLLASADLRRSMGAAARALAERKFDRQLQVEWLERVYDSVSRGAPLTAKGR